MYGAATSTPIRTRSVPPPLEEDRISLLEEAPFEPNVQPSVQPNVQRRAPDSLPPPAPEVPRPPNLPTAVGDVPLRHLTRSPGVASKDDSARSDGRALGHEDTYRSLPEPPRTLQADAPDRTPMPVSRPLTSVDPSEHDTSPREGAERSP
jgi:hypothetical protein